VPCARCRTREWFLPEEIEQARAGMSRRPIRSSIADCPDKLGLAAGVNIDEAFRARVEAPLTAKFSWLPGFANGGYVGYKISIAYFSG